LLCKVSKLEEVDPIISRTKKILFGGFKRS